jgi:hypothetical protein
MLCANGGRNSIFSASIILLFQFIYAGKFFTRPFLPSHLTIPPLSQQSLGLVHYYQPRRDDQVWQHLACVRLFLICLPHCWLMILLLSIIAVFDSLASEPMAAKIHSRLTAWLHFKAQNPNSTSLHIHTFAAKVLPMLSTGSLCSLSTSIWGPSTAKWLWLWHLCHSLHDDIFFWSCCIYHPHSSKPFFHFLAFHSLIFYYLAIIPHTAPGPAHLESQIHPQRQVWASEFHSIQRTCQLS